MSKNCIFLITDNAFFKQTVICLQTLSKNYPLHPDVIICALDLSYKQKIFLNSLLPCVFIESDLSEKYIWPVMSSVEKSVNPLSFWSRFLIWVNPIFDKYDKVLYIDGDLVICKPLDKIFKYDFYIERDLYQGLDGVFLNPEDEKLKILLSSDSLVLSDYMANAGVFCISRKVRNLASLQDFLLIKNKYLNYLKYADQSVINLWIQKNNLYIDPKHVFNFQYISIFKRNGLKTIRSAYIVHFNGIHNKERIILMKLSFLLKNKYGIFFHMLIYMILSIRGFFRKILRYLRQNIRKYCTHE